MIEIIPAVMPRDYDDLVGKAKLFSGVAPLVQLDIMDGKFVPARTWPYPRDAHFDAMVTKESEGIPQWEELDFEADLMIENPELWVPKWVMAGARRIIVHVESMRDFEKIRQAVPQGLIELGLAINNSTPLSALESYIDRIDFVQCMGIDHIGFQGQPFDERVLGRVRDLREKFPNMMISIDGSVNKNTAKRLVDAGATRLVAGSAILEHGDVAHAIRELENLVK